MNQYGCSVLMYFTLCFYVKSFILFLL
jgi:hypothetical protein